MVFAAAVVIAGVYAGAPLEAAQGNKAKTETKETTQTIGNYAYTQKAEFVGRMKKGMAKLDKELDRLSAKVDRSSGAAKADAKTQLATVREKWAQANKQLDKASNATEATWDNAQRDFKKSYGDLNDSFNKARQWLSEKIKP
jgi:phytoene dehydrogenase-like protein